MVDVFEEVEEQLRQEKYLDALKQWGPWVGGAAAAIVVVAAGYQWWTHNQTVAAEAASLQYLSAIDQLVDENLGLADAGLDTVTREGTAGYRTLALLQRAAIALENDDPAAAADLYDQAAASTSEPVVRDLAQLKSIWARWDSLSFADIEIRLMPLADGGAPYRWLARESIGAAALREGNLERAESEYQLLAFSFETSDEARRRAQEALAVIAARNALAAADVPVDEQAVTEDSEND